eukprot:TRINITY_DN5574_c0_g1_i1.p1 TRINITY_DN5574_c0_g1~~TRINITY_DN5574_c0_g1_i1.p1  ORF type:complete len:633 (-),score=214.00 TRINITY_DN5574_c0_g1_i1:12-1910(-)
MNLSLLFVFFCFFVSASSSEKSFTELIQELSTKVQSTQISKAQKFEPPFKWSEVKGIYPSQIKLNFVGNPLVYEVRKEFEIFDNNMFVTVWVLDSLLTARKFNPDLVNLSEEKILEALQVISAFRDKNINKKSSDSIPAYNFWSQINDNGTWSAFPDNLGMVTADTSSFLDILGTFFDDIFLKSIGKKLEDIANGLTMLSNVFHVPPDFDDSGCNLAVGALLADSNEFPKSKAYWNKLNSNVPGLIDRATRYAYRPFSKDPNQSSIDPRTFFFAYEWIYEQQENNQKSGRNDPITLLPTWVMNLEESRKMAPKGVAMPEYINNVDISVASNFINGILNYIIQSDQDQFSFMNEDFQGLLLNTSNYISWSLSSGRILERPDIAMLYYPSLYNFYWFSSRVCATLNDPKAVRLFGKYPVLKEMKRIWEEASREHSSGQLLALSNESDEFVYWEDFLGLADTGFFGRSDQHPDDRVFSTSVSVNALMDAWGVPTNDSACPVEYHPSTPSKVKIAIQRGVYFLREAVETGDYEFQNAFFSGSIKSSSSVPQFFPANRWESLNGTWSDRPFKGGVIEMVHGVPKKSDYMSWIKNPPNGPIPTFDGFNSDPFPFWNSEPLTYASILASFSKYEALTRC